jgi:hypothetical protein
MNKLKIGLADALLWLDVLAMAFLVFILISIWVFRDRVFTIGNPLSLVDLIMLVGMISVLLFNAVSLFWLSRVLFKGANSRATDSVLFGLCILCLVMMMTEKAMVDDIAHETASGWSIQGEYLMLYGMLFLQLTYNLLIGMRLLPRQPESAAKSHVPGR